MILNVIIPLFATNTVIVYAINVEFEVEVNVVVYGFSYYRM